MATPTPPPETGFAPSDLSDGRGPGDWQGRYRETKARVGIWCEALFLLLCFVLCLSGIVGLRLGALFPAFRNAGDDTTRALLVYGCGTLAGGLGGTIFSMKWLYHMVAKHLWNEDRRLWRVLTPLISSGLAFGVLTVINSRVFGIFDMQLASTPSRSTAVGFLVGLFSDNTVAKLAEVAESIFAVRSKKTNGSP